ncbi:C-factor [Hydrogenophaga crassostreae]|uniref:C-factor n=1 Tax=Hydrogenophaga crassostreae TaxID=1763535 RepID=A0A167HDE5_9BURK|nr:SDR family NAD(P)-dependent oxidoreductase [Hydrogenophaga crassostreae]AOW12061.1 C-factor [Hydrogenophaga crassostreae]OAD41005.1 C-factor [Hydrogenophaga crassostreae]
MDPSQLPVVRQGVTLVLGAGGGLGASLAGALTARGEAVILLGRDTLPAFDYRDTASIERGAQHVANQLNQWGQPLVRVLVTTGFLHGLLPNGEMATPERSWQQLDATALSHSFLINAIGPAMVIKHVFPLLPRQGRCVAAFLSARVGSVGDNLLGGWYGYRASKAALNQLVHTAAIELNRHNRAAVCVALHPGTVDTHLSRPFAKTGLQVRTPDVAADEILAVVDGLSPAQSGGFWDHHGRPVPW